MRVARHAGTVVLTVVTLAVAATLATAAAWTPNAWVTENTLELQTTEPSTSPHWSTVWLVVLDGQVYVRLGSRAAGRVERNSGGMVVPVRIAGQEFPRVRLVPAPEQADAVAKAMADKYWSDVLIRWVDHPLTARLEPEPGM